MRKKKVTFSNEELDEAENGYTKEIPEQELPYYQQIIMKELKKRKSITITHLVNKFNLPERSLGNNIDKMLRNGIIKDWWEWKKAPDGRRRHYHLYTLKK